MQYFIITNLGNDSIALIQYLKNNLYNLDLNLNFENITLIRVDTGSGSQNPKWLAHCEKTLNWIKNLGLNIQTISSKVNFENLCLTRGNFPTPKLQWCAGFLKGLPILDYLDEVDPDCEGVIILSHRKDSSIKRQNLPEWIDHSEHYNDRKVWHPMLAIDLNTRNELVKSAGFELLPHRSLECEPCVNSDSNDWLRLSNSKIQKISELENKLDQTLFNYKEYKNLKNIQNLSNLSNLSDAVNQLKDLNYTYSPDPEDFDEASLFERGCGSPFGCGQ